MNCSYVRLPGGGAAFVCGARPSGRTLLCRRCQRPAPFLCDWRIEILGQHAGSCSAAICQDHALEVGPDKHLCPEHQVAYVLYLQRLGIAY